MRFEVNLSDFCIYYQQPTNNTPEFALRIGYMQQNLPHLLLLAYSAVAFSCLLDYLAPYFRGCRCSDIAAARSYAYVCIRHSCDECPHQPPISAAPLFPVAPVHRSFIARSSHYHRTCITRTSPVHCTLITRTAYVQHTSFVRIFTCKLRANSFLWSRYWLPRARVSLNIIN